MQLVRDTLRPGEGRIGKYLVHRIRKTYFTIIRHKVWYADVWWTWRLNNNGRVMQKIVQVKSFTKYNAVMKAKSTFLFSNVELRQRLIDLCPPQYKEAFATSLFNGDYITRKLNTNRKKAVVGFDWPVFIFSQLAPPACGILKTASNGG